MRTTLTLSTALALLGSALTVAATAPAEPPLHHVRYTVTAEAP